VTPAARVVLVRLATDWEALYVEGQLVKEGHVSLDLLPGYLPDFNIETIDVTAGQWGNWGFRAPQTLEEL